MHLLTTTITIITTTATIITITTTTMDIRKLKSWNTSIQQKYLYNKVFKIIFFIWVGFKVNWGFEVFSTLWHSNIFSYKIVGPITLAAEIAGFYLLIRVPGIRATPKIFIHYFYIVFSWNLYFFSSLRVLFSRFFIFTLWRIIATFLKYFL